MLVNNNIKNSFPEKSEKEISQISKKFYRHFCDTFIETIAFPFMKQKELMQRYKIKNPELCNQLFEEGKSITLLMGHFGNWEWSSLLPLSLKHKIYAIYKPLHNKQFDKFFKNNREKFGLKAVPMEKIFRVLAEGQKNNEKNMTYFLADQRPRWAQIQHWTTFMNQDTPVILGPEKISKKLNNSVVFFKIIPEKRGYYKIEFHLLFKNAKETKNYEITEGYLQILEETIKENPAYWLWTHHRWKHEKEKFVQKAKPLG